MARTERDSPKVLTELGPSVRNNSATRAIASTFGVLVEILSIDLGLLFVLDAKGAGVTLIDYDNDGWLYIYLVDGSTYKALDGKESSPQAALFHNNHDGTGTFTDVSYEVGIATATIPFVGFGDGFLDFDNDGWQDLLVANGHVYPSVDQHPEWGTTYAQRPLLFHNLENGKFELVPAVEGTGLAEVGDSIRKEE